jgi:hypothetical protein
LRPNTDNFCRISEYSGNVLMCDWDVQTTEKWNDLAIVDRELPPRVERIPARPAALKQYSLLLPLPFLHLCSWSDPDFSKMIDDPSKEGI